MIIKYYNSILYTIFYNKKKNELILNSTYLNIFYNNRFLGFNLLIFFTKIKLIKLMYLNYYYLNLNSKTIKIIENQTKQINPLKKHRLKKKLKFFKYKKDFNNFFFKFFKKSKKSYNILNNFKKIKINYKNSLFISSNFFFDYSYYNTNNFFKNSNSLLNFNNDKLKNFSIFYNSKINSKEFYFLSKNLPMLNLNNLVYFIKPFNNTLLFGKNVDIIIFNKFIKNSKKINFSFFIKKIKIKNNFYIYNYIKNIVNVNDLFNFSLVSSKYLNNYIYLFSKNNFLINTNNIKKNNKYIYNNYYPVFIYKNDNNLYNLFFKKFKSNLNVNFVLFTNKIIINFIESFSKRRIFIKTLNNFNRKINNYYFKRIVNEHKNYQPLYWKNFMMLDFLDIIWYSFLLKDLKMLSDWVSKFMETLNFKNHKKFLSFFNNFINKYSGVFMDVLRIKGFFFDIRGKVGVTGSSKKRHICFKFGSINKSSKQSKIDFNQNLVRTYSGVMGLTYIICY